MDLYQTAVKAIDSTHALVFGRDDDAGAGGLIPVHKPRHAQSQLGPLNIGAGPGVGAGSAGG